MLETAIVLSITLIFSIVSFKKKLLNTTGIIFADVVGGLTFVLGGINSFAAIVLFYVVAESATRITKNKENHEQRTTRNILGNAGAAILALFLGQVTPFFGAISAALADTVSSEIGMLSANNPRLITSFEKVKKGTDGGITLLGTIAALIAGALIGGFYYFAINASLKIAILIVGAGFFGSIIDSVLGAIMERKGLLSNTQVNFIASSSGAIIVFLGMALL